MSSGNMKHVKNPIVIIERAPCFDKWSQKATVIVQPWQRRVDPFHLLTFTPALFTTLAFPSSKAQCAVRLFVPRSFRRRTFQQLLSVLIWYVLMSTLLKSTPLVAPGHTRPITHLSFSPLQDDGTYLLISSCKDGNPMLREWTGDWIGTFLGHKGAVWSSKFSLDGSRAASGSADFTA